MKVDEIKMTVGELIDILKTFKQDSKVYYDDLEYGGFVFNVTGVEELKESVRYYFNNNEVTEVTEGVVIY